MLNFLILFDVFNVPELVQDGKEFLIISTILAIFKTFKTLSVIYLDAKNLKENFVEYGLSLMKARYNWIPYIEKIGKGTIDFSHIVYPSLVGT